MNILNRHDFLELETRGRLDLTIKRRQQTIETTRRALRSDHVTFLWKTYFFAACLLMWAIYQWNRITSSRQWPAKLMSYHGVEIAGVIYSSFIFLLSMPFVLRRDRVLTNTTLCCYIFTMFQLTSIILVTPLTEINPTILTKAFGLTSCVGVISLLLALIYHYEMEYDHVHLSIWSVRYFLTSSIVLFLTLVMDNVYVATTTTLALVFFLTVHAIIFGRSLGSLQFYKDESPLLSVYVILTYLLFVSLLASSIEFFIQIEKAM